MRASLVIAAAVEVFAPSIASMDQTRTFYFPTLENADK
jgi:hypothetical protein